MAFQRMVVGFSYLIFCVVLYVAVNHLIKQKIDQSIGVGTRLSNTGDILAETNLAGVDQETAFLAEIPKFEWPKFKKADSLMLMVTPRIIIHEKEELLKVGDIGQ